MNYRKIEGKYSISKLPWAEMPKGWTIAIEMRYFNENSVRAIASMKGRDLDCHFTVSRNNHDATFEIRKGARGERLGAPVVDFTQRYEPMIRKPGLLPEFEFNSVVGKLRPDEIFPDVTAIRLRDKYSIFYEDEYNDDQLTFARKHNAMGYSSLKYYMERNPPVGLLPPDVWAQVKEVYKDLPGIIFHNEITGFESDYGNYVLYQGELNHEQIESEFTPVQTADELNRLIEMVKSAT